MIQELEKDSTHPRNSRSSQTSPSHHQDQLAHSWTESNILATTKVFTDGKELDDPEGKHGSHPRNRSVREKPRQPLEDPPPPGRPPRDKTATPKLRLASTTT